MKLHIDGKIILLHVLETHVDIKRISVCSENDAQSMCTLNASQCDCFYVSKSRKIEFL